MLLKVRRLGFVFGKPAELLSGCTLFTEPGIGEATNECSDRELCRDMWSSGKLFLLTLGEVIVETIFSIWAQEQGTPVDCLPSS